MNWFEITVIAALVIIVYSIYKKNKRGYLISYPQPETQEIAVTLRNHEKELPSVLDFGTDDLPIKFEKLTLPTINSDKKSGSIISSTAKQSIPTLVIDAATMYGAKGLFRATISPGQLLQYADGTLSSMVKGSKGIAAHSGFSQACTSGIFAPIIIFQALSVVTGQYYLNGITKQLSAIAQRLEFLIQLHHNEKISILQAHYERLVELASAKKCTYGVEDLVELGAIRRDANAIHKEYTNLLNQIDEHVFYSILNDNILANTMVKELQKRFDESNIVCIANLLLFSRRVLFASKLLEMKANVFMAQETRNRVSTINNSIAELGKFRNELLHAEKKIQNVLHCLKDVAQKIENQAWRESSKSAAKELCKQYSEEAGEVFADINDVRNDVVNMLDLINERINQKKDAYIIIGSKGEIIPIEGIER